MKFARILISRLCDIVTSNVLRSITKFFRQILICTYLQFYLVSTIHNCSLYYTFEAYDALPLNDEYVVLSYSNPIQFIYSAVKLYSVIVFLVQHD